MYETWKSDAQRPHQERDDEHVRERERVECVGDRDRADQERAAEVGCDHDLPLAGALVGPGARVEREEEVRRELGGDEIAHLGGIRVERQDGDERQGDQADLVAEQRDGLAEPETAELRVLAQEGRHHHGGGTLVSRRDAGPPRPDRRHRGLGRHVRAGQGRGRALSALRLPRRPLCDRVARARRAGRRADALTGSPWLGRRRLARPPAGDGLRAADGRARADDRLERRLHHRPLRRLHAAPRAAALPDPSGQSRLDRGRARGRRARDALGRQCGRPRRRPARARRLGGVLGSDRADGAVRAALRPGRVHAGRDARGVRRLRRCRRRARPGGDAARLDGLGCAARHRHLRECARVSRPDLGAATGERDPDRARVRDGAGLCRASSGSGWRATGSGRWAGAAAP